MRVIHILILSIFLTGCSIFQKKPEPPAIVPQVVNIDSAVLLPCEPLKEVVDIKTFEDIIVTYADMATSYANCANKQAASVKLLKQFGNIK